MLRVSLQSLRRLAISKQRLAPPPSATPDILETVRAIGCLQLDPLRIVERSHRLVLWSRLGRYDEAELERLLWRDRRLFEYWAHCASIVLTEDFPFFLPMMRRHPAGDSRWAKRAREWIEENRRLKRYILREIRERGPLRSRDLEEGGAHPSEWVSTGWTSGRNISRMLDFLWLSGTIMVAGRDSLQKIWDLSERCLPEWTPREPLAPRALEERAAERAIRSLGAATERQIKAHFIRGRYPRLGVTLASLARAKTILPVKIEHGGRNLPGDWYLHRDDLPRLEAIERGEWRERTTLLSPFDNLICDRARTKAIFGFDYTVEIYVPPAKRKYGYYVLPILHGDRLIGRIDPAMDREKGIFKVYQVHAEADAPGSAGPDIRKAIEDLAGFLGAGEVRIDSRRVAKVWRKSITADC